MTTREYDAMNWEDRLRYAARNPNDEAVRAEDARVRRKLAENATPEAVGYLQQLSAARGGVDAEAAVSGAFDRSAYPVTSGEPVAIRRHLNALGVDDSDIGYSRGTDGVNRVTLYGRPLMEPELNADGTTYAGQDAVDSAVRRYANDNLVAVRDYVDAQPMPVAVHYRDGVVNVNGVGVKPAFIQNGVAYVQQAALDDVLRQTGGKTGGDLLRENSEAYDPLLEQISRELASYGNFHYDYRTDPEYKAFERYWSGQANRRYQDTIAQLEAQTGGLPSLGALAAAASLYQDDLDQMAAYRKQFRDDAYDRWLDGYGRLTDAQATVADMQQAAFDRAQQVYEAQLSDFRDNQKRAADEEAALLERQRTERLDAIDAADRETQNAQDAALFQLTLENKGLTNDGLRIANNQKQFEADLDRAKVRGYFTEEEIERWGLNAETANPYRLELELEAIKTAAQNERDDHATANDIYLKRQPTAAQLSSKK